jgi:hypothetical protein
VNGSGFPRGALTPDFLASALDPSGRARIRRVTAAPVGNGKMSECVRLTLDWSPPDHGPASLVAKLASESPARRRLATAARAYEIEAGFYRDLSAALPIRTLACHYVQTAPGFCLLLEDLSDRPAGAPADACTPDQAAAALEELAGLHAAGGPWTKARPSWLREHSAAEAVEHLAIACGPRFLQRFAARLDDRVLGVVDRLLGGGGRFGADARTPVTLLHGDYRNDNLLFGDGDGARDGGVAVVDWQTAALGPAVSDASYFLLTSLTPADRHRHQEDLLAHYRDRAKGLGLVIDEGDCLRDDRDQSWRCLARTVATAALTSASPADDDLFAVLVERCAERILEEG